MKIISNLLSHTFESLQFKNFRMLWFGVVFGMAGIQMQMVIRGIYVYDITDSAFLTGFVGMGFAPSLLFVSIYGGVISDRLERRLIIQIAQTTNAILAASIGLLIFFDFILWWNLLIVSVVQGAMFSIMMPARQAAISTLVDKKSLPNAYALNAMAMSLMGLLSPALAGFLYEWINPYGVYFVISLILMSAVFFTSLVPKMYPKQIEHKKVLREFYDGLSYLASNRIICMILLYSVVVALLTMPFRMLIQVFAKDVYGALPSEVGMLMTSVAIGGIVGSILIANLRKGNHRGFLLIIGAVVSGLALILISSVPYFIAGVFGLIGIGLGEQARWALGQSLVMENSKEEFRGRMMSILMMTFGLMPLGMLPLGFAMAKQGAQIPVFISGVFLLIFSLVIFIFSGTIRRIS